MKNRGPYSAVMWHRATRGTPRWLCSSHPSNQQEANHTHCLQAGFAQRGAWGSSQQSSSLVVKDSSSHASYTLSCVACRLAAALKAKGGNNLSSALAATKAAQEHATCTADRAAAVRLQEVITKQLAAQQAAAGQRGQVLQAPAQQQQQHMQPQRRAANADSSKAQAYGVSSSAAASVSIKCDVDGIGAGSACRPHVDGKPSSTSNSTSGSSWDCIRSDAVHKQQHQHELLSRDDDKPTISTGIRSDTSGCAAVPAGLGCGTSSSKSSRSSSTDAVEQLLQQFVSALQQPGGSSTPRSSEDVQRPSRSSTHTSTRGAAGVTMPVAGNHKRDCAGDIEVHLKPLLPNGPGGSCASKPPQMYPASKPLIEVLTSSDTSLDDDHLVTD